MNRFRPFRGKLGTFVVFLAACTAWAGPFPASAQLSLDGPDVLIHTDPDARDEPAVVAADPLGRPFVCWPRWFGSEIECGLFDADLSPVAPPRAVDGETERHTATRLSLVSNRSTFALGWEGHSLFGNGVYGRPLDLQGEPLDYARPIAEGREGFRSQIDLAALADGSYFGVWMGTIDRGDGVHGIVIFGQRFDGSMQALGPAIVLLEPPFPSRNPRVLPSPGGGFLLLWMTDYEGVYSRPYGVDGTPAGPKVRIDRTKFDASVELLVGSLSAAVGNGRFLVSWDVDHYIRGTTVRGRILDGTGRPIGDEIQLSGPRSLHADLPTVAADGAGGFVVAWRGAVDTIGNGRILARRFDDGGAARSGDIEVNGDPTTFHTTPEIARLEPGRLVVVWSELVQNSSEYRVRARTLTAPPIPPAGDWLASPAVPGFSVKIRFSTPSGSLLGAQEPGCIAETICVSGALPGRSEVFARVVGPKPNGFLWPTLVKFSTSQVEAWVRQDATGEVRYYVLEGARPGFDELPGLFDRTGFLPAGEALVASNDALFARGGIGPIASPVIPGGVTVVTSERFPDFRFGVRITAGGQAQEVRAEASCIEETLCLSAAVPGRSEIFLRVVGPKPNGKLWPTIVKFTTSQVEVWVEQISTGQTKHYVIAGAAPGRDDLTGLFDRQGFEP